MNIAYQMPNQCVTSALNDSTLPHGLWFGRRSSFDNILTFGTLHTCGVSKPSTNSLFSGAKCIMLGVAVGFPC